MKILLLQIEDRNDPKLKNLMNQNQKFCSTNSELEYVFLTKSKEDVPPYWAKVFEITKLMKQRNDIDYVMWLDSDALLVNFSNLKTLLKSNPQYSFFCSPDAPIWLSSFNAGAFVVKNNSIGNQIMNVWCTYYPRQNWTNQNGAWSTTGAWAGKDYEQGSFVSYILTNNKFKQHICMQPYFIFQSMSCSFIDPKTISVHLSGFLKNLPTAESCYDTNYKTANSINYALLYGLCVTFVLFVVLILLVVKNKI